ncbi:hypothetical protein QYE76_007506 [Lolium multiflorum]|uniref:Uncharacterized protein n=1 Tax=Lolium multiflorum TaxID=4521 RepID=A0AAD8S089_LOLMU|nr:hypothetical protein QYE76_007506 [Lolium multiflorum]
MMPCFHASPNRALHTGIPSNIRGMRRKSALGLVGTRDCRPSGILTILLKKYWPGLYRTIPDGRQKLALKWEDYHAAPCGVMTTIQDGRQIVPTCAQVVLMTFWEHYKVSAGTDQREATAVLELMAKKNLRDTFYHICQLAISHYFAEQGKRRNKDRVIAENLTIEDDAGWERTEDVEFKAKSIQNKANHGKGGTHNQGNKPFPLYEKDMVAANGGQEIPRIQVWQTAHKKKELVEGKVVYYCKTEVSMESYKKAFKSLCGEDSDPLSEPLDEMAAMISSGGKPHGRTSILNAVHKPTITLPRIRHMTSSSGVCMPPRPQRSTQTSDEARVAEAYEQLQEEFQQKMHEYEEACSASSQHNREQTKALFEAPRTSSQPPQYVEPPVVPPLPRMPTKMEFLAQLYGGTPGSSTHSNSPFGRAATSSPDASPAERTPLHFGGPSPGHSAGASPRCKSRESRQHSPHLFSPGPKLLGKDTVILTVFLETDAIAAAPCSSSSLRFVTNC